MLFKPAVQQQRSKVTAGGAEYKPAQEKHQIKLQERAAAGKQRQSCRTPHAADQQHTPQSQAVDKVPQERGEQQAGNHQQRGAQGERPAGKVKIADDGQHHQVDGRSNQ